MANQNDGHVIFDLATPGLNSNLGTAFNYCRSSYNCLFVCVEVLQPSQPNGIMSSANSLPNHTFTGQA